MPNQVPSGTHRRAAGSFLPFWENVLSDLLEVPLAPSHQTRPARERDHPGGWRARPARAALSSGVSDIQGPGVLGLNEDRAHGKAGARRQRGAESGVGAPHRPPSTLGKTTGARKVLGAGATSGFCWSLELRSHVGTVGGGAHALMMMPLGLWGPEGPWVHSHRGREGPSRVDGRSGDSSSACSSLIPQGASGGLPLVFGITPSRAAVLGTATRPPHAERLRGTGGPATENSARVLGSGSRGPAPSSKSRGLSRGLTHSCCPR